MREVNRPLFIPRRPLIASMLASDPERNWFRIAKAFLISSTRPALTSVSAPAEERRGSDGQAPQGVYPASADPNPWGDSLLRSHPVVETQAIVRIAEAGAERLGRGRWRECGHRPTAFCHRSRLATTAASVAKLCERRALVEGDMVSLGALDLILRNAGVRVMGIALVLDIAHMHANDRATDPSGLGIPTHAIADLEGFGHDDSVQC